MKALVSYVDFHWDNHQGGSGKSFELTCSIEIPDDLIASDFFEYVHKTIGEKVKRERPFEQNEKYSIQKIQVV